MEYRLFEDTYILRVDKGEEVIESLKSLCEKEKIDLAEINGLGASDYVEMGLYEVEKKEFFGNIIKEPVEITSLHGNVSKMNGEVYLHLHATFAKKDGSVVGGHLKKCLISATSEIFVRKINGFVDRKYDEVTGLNLYEFK